MTRAPNTCRGQPHRHGRRRHGRLGGGRGVRLEASGNIVRDNLVSGQGTGIAVRATTTSCRATGSAPTQTASARCRTSPASMVFGGDDNLIGGTADGEGNLVSGNAQRGVRIDCGAPRPSNDIQGNLIGTTSTGDAPLPNGDAGVTIGGSKQHDRRHEPRRGNVISGNAGAAWRRARHATATGVRQLDRHRRDRPARPRQRWQRRRHRRRHETGSATTRALAANTIAHNGDDGVTVDAGTGNAVLRNSIADNGGLAIDLGDDGPTANDADDLDPGANDLQNGPEIEEATVTTVEWSSRTTTKRVPARVLCLRHGRAAGEGADLPRLDDNVHRRQRPHRRHHDARRPPSEPATTWR